MANPALPLVNPALKTSFAKIAGQKPQTIESGTRLKLFSRKGWVPCALVEGQPVREIEVKTYFTLFESPFGITGVSLVMPALQILDGISARAD